MYFAGLIHSFNAFLWLLPFHDMGLTYSAIFVAPRHSLTDWCEEPDVTPSFSPFCFFFFFSLFYVVFKLQTGKKKRNKQEKKREKETYVSGLYFKAY